MATPAPFCGHCGRPFADGAAFCGTCGRPRGTLGPDAPAPDAPAPVVPTPAAPRVPRTPRTPRTPPAAQVALAASGLVSALPWQTVVAGRRPDLTAWLTQAGASAASSAVRASLRRPGLALVVTTALDLLVAALAGPAALQAAWPRALAGLVTSGLALASGSRGGPLRTLAGLAGVATTLVGLVSAGLALLTAAGAGADPAVLLPQVVTMVSSLVVAARTATLALRRTP
nr:zinc ribbon domain-containing protein [Propionibacterium sp.]